MDLFPGKMCSGRRGRRCDGRRDSEPGARLACSSRSGVLSPKGTRASGVGQEGFALSSPDPNRLPTGCRAGEGGRMAGENAPGKHPLPLPESWECRWSGEQPDRLWAEGGVKPGISRVLLHKIPQAFQPCKVEAHGGEKEPAYFSGLTLSQQRLPIPSPRAPKCSPGFERSFLCVSGRKLFPFWKPGLTQTGVSSWIVAILWQD